MKNRIFLFFLVLGVIGMILIVSSPKKSMPAESYITDVIPGSGRTVTVYIDFARVQAQMAELNNGNTDVYLLTDGFGKDSRYQKLDVGIFTVFLGERFCLSSGPKTKKRLMLNERGSETETFNLNGYLIEVEPQTMSIVSNNKKNKK